MENENSIKDFNKSFYSDVIKELGNYGANNENIEAVFENILFTIHGKTQDESNVFSHDKNSKTANLNGEKYSLPDYVKTADDAYKYSIYQSIDKKELVSNVDKYLKFHVPFQNEVDQLLFENGVTKENYYEVFEKHHIKLMDGVVNLEEGFTYDSINNKAHLNGQEITLPDYVSEEGQAKLYTSLQSINVKEIVENLDKKTMLFYEPKSLIEEIESQRNSQKTLDKQLDLTNKKGRSI